MKHLTIITLMIGIIGCDRSPVTNYDEVVVIAELAKTYETGQPITVGKWHELPVIMHEMNIVEVLRGDVSGKSINVQDIEFLIQNPENDDPSPLGILGNRINYDAEVEISLNEDVKMVASVACNKCKILYLLYLKNNNGTYIPSRGYVGKSVISIIK